MLKRRARAERFRAERAAVAVDDAQHAAGDAPRAETNADQEHVCKPPCRAASLAALPARAVATTTTETRATRAAQAARPRRARLRRARSAADDGPLRALNAAAIAAAHALRAETRRLQRDRFAHAGSCQVLRGAFEALCASSSALRASRLAPCALRSPLRLTHRAVQPTTAAATEHL